MKTFAQGIRKTFDFRGRSSRWEFWGFTAWCSLLLIPCLVIDQFRAGFDEGVPFVFTGLFLLLTVIASLSVSVRRLHDIGRSGWWVVAGMVPVAGSFGLGIAAMFPSDAGPNAYGTPPAGADTVLRVLMRTVLSLLLVIGLCAAAGGWAVVRAKGQIQTDGQVLAEHGRLAGANHTESGCVNESMQRLQSTDAALLPNAARESVWLQGCLAASRSEGEFCEGVPGASDIVAGSLWAVQVCSQAAPGSQSGCHMLMRRVARYCASPEHRSKIAQGNAPGSS